MIVQQECPFSHNKSKNHPHNLLLISFLNILAQKLSLFLRDNAFSKRFTAQNHFYVLQQPCTCLAQTEA
jgi:hypothetical protein